MFGRSEAGEIVFTPVPRMFKFMASAPAVALACSMAALKVHCFPEVEGSVSQALAVVDASGASPVPFTTKVVEARALVAAVMLASTIAATSSRPAINVFVLHTDACPLVLWMVISTCSFLALPGERLALFCASDGTLGSGGRQDIVRGAYWGYLF